MVFDDEDKSRTVCSPVVVAVAFAMSELTEVLAGESE